MERPLHRLERRLLKELAKLKESDVIQLSSKAGLKPDQTRRAVEWLRSKGFVAVRTRQRLKVALGPRGIRAAETGLPERRLVKLLMATGGRAPLDQARRMLEGEAEEFSAALGVAKARGWVRIRSVEGRMHAELHEEAKPSPEELLVDRLAKQPAYVDTLTASERRAFSILAKRPNYLTITTVRAASIRLTPSGAKVAQRVREAPEVDALSSELLLSGRWRQARLRPIDVEAPTVSLHPGKKHPMQRLIDETREAFVSLGFEEIDGPIIRPCFWNFDALFIPQDHPAREMQDTFYLSDLRARTLGEAALVERVAQVHRNGGETGSKGWRYNWSEDEARRLVLRTHTTAITVNYLAEHRPAEARVFSVGRIFRNEKPTYKNLVEFHQIDGVTVGGSVNLRDMMGLLEQFYRRLGLGRVKFWPTYFPYTEPSLQSVVYVEKLGKWIELCGMGIFRPEVTLPLGVRNPVLAWGGGLERIAMVRFGLKDIRQLYENDLTWLRRVPVCQ